MDLATTTILPAPTPAVNADRRPSDGLRNPFVPKQLEQHEDLFAESTSLAVRVEFALAEPPGVVVAGVGRDGRATVFWGAHDAMADFDSNGLVRKIIDYGRVFRSEGDRLSELEHRRSPGQVTLVRRDLPADRQSAICDSWRQRIVQLVDAYACGMARIARQSCDGASELLLDRLRAIAGTRLGLAPAIRRQRPSEPTVSQPHRVSGRIAGAEPSAVTNKG